MSSRAPFVSVARATADRHDAASTGPTACHFPPPDAHGATLGFLQRSQPHHVEVFKPARSRTNVQESITPIAPINPINPDLHE
ncbi:hypothetical protein AB0O67_34720 [Streptomyces sp. NPDC086077]|uniref:hypothetical protein n=1 Tax=Streptomyces sp. NPDC086077 TaxID=3154862 RepID=UPI0034268149